MKKVLLTICLLSLSLVGMAQTVDYTLRYDIPKARYEVYARPNFTQSQYNWGSAQVSVVTPSSLANAAFTVTSVAAGGWTDNSQAYDVQGSDFHGVGSTGLKVDLTANQETLLFHFTLPGGVCLPGLRLYINGVDPNSSVPGMLGGDFANTMYSANDILGANNLYIQNYANGGTVCTNCTLTAPTLSK
ncbi:hypothetical protein GGR92_002889 [Spirosoma lacussanchae]|uniref:hypothetical protein n=1 Tax=Spirosoma lacussanchae TaxID=1884249 RepID=UPI001FEC7EDE|nr:hypothetical protein [Spirosoma lacussanchae]